LFVDAAGTLLSPAEDTATVYSRYASPYGLTLTADEILARYRRSYAKPWAASSIRYVGDGKPFWRFIVSESTGIDDERMFTAIYEYYSRPEAWRVAPGAREALRAVREDLGMKTAVVSNFDRRLHDILDALELKDLFDAVVVSADRGAEKPNPVLFQCACEALDVRPEHVVHVGDDRRNDVQGARDAGCYAWLMGADVLTFDDVLERIRTGNLIDSLSDPL
jgi:REG-2-like HAD superfamily hydrolase